MALAGMWIATCAHLLFAATYCALAWRAYQRAKLMGSGLAVVAAILSVVQERDRQEQAREMVQ